MTDIILREQKGELQMFHHIVFISFVAGASEQHKEQARQMLLDLGRRTPAEYGLVSWKVEPNLDRRPRGLIGYRTIGLIEHFIFKDKTSFESWKQYDGHKIAGARLGLVADWVIGDFELSSQEIALVN